MHGINNVKRSEIIFIRLVLWHMCCFIKCIYFSMLHQHIPKKLNFSFLLSFFLEDLFFLKKLYKNFSCLVIGSFILFCSGGDDGRI